MPFSLPQQRASRLFHRRIGLVAAAVVFAAGILTSIQGDSLMRHTAGDFARRRASEVATAAAVKLAADVEAQLQRYNALHSLANVIALTEMVGGASRFGAFAEQRLSDVVARDNPDVRQVAIADTRSRVVWSTIGGRPTGIVDLSDRPHIRAILVDGQQEFLGAPVVGRVSNQRTVQFSHRLAGPQGETIGASVVSIDPAGIGRGAQAELGGLDWALTQRDGTYIQGATSAATASTPASPGDERLSPWVTRWVQPLNLAVTVTVPVALVAGWEQAEHQRLRWVVLPMVAGGTLLLLAGIAVVEFWHYRVRKRDDQERRDVESALVKQITDALPDMIVLWSLDAHGEWGAEFVSKASQSLLGMPPADLIGGARWLIVHPDDEARVDARFAALVAGSPVAPIEYRLLGADMRWIWVEVMTRAFSMDDGGAGPRRFLSAFRDISERRRLLEELEQTRRRIAVLVENSPGVFYERTLRTGANGESILALTYISPNIKRLTGYSAEEFLVLGHIAPIIGDDNASRRQAYFQTVIEAGSGTDEFEIITRDGKRGRARSRDLFTLADDQCGVVTGYAWDVTREDELERELQQAAKLAFLGEMAAGLAHEMNQPLAAISMQAAMIEMLLPDGAEMDPAKSAALSGRIAKITALVERAAGVIERVRRFARNDALTVAPFQPDDGIVDAIDMLRVKLRNAEVTVDYQPSQRTALGDAGGFSQVIANLLANAADAYANVTGDRPRIVSVETTEVAGKLCIAVADHAGGISDVVIHRLFEPFVTTKKVASGTGLGLSICHRIMQEMGGSLTGANHGDGARFLVSLPLAPPEPSP